MNTLGIRPARVLTACVLAAALGCVVATIIALSSMGAMYGLAPSASDVLVYLYQINAIFCVFAVVLACAVLFAHRARSVLVRTMSWAMLILAVMYVTPFVTDTLAYLSAMDFLSAFRYSCAYIPFFALIGALVTLLASWTSASHGVCSIVCMVCSLVAVFSSVVYLWQVVPSVVAPSTLFDGAQIWAIILGYLAVTLITLDTWFATLSERAFYLVLCGLSAEDAYAAQETRRREEQGRAALMEQVRLDHEKELEDEESGSEKETDVHSQHLEDGAETERDHEDEDHASDGEESVNEAADAPGNSAHDGSETEETASSEQDASDQQKSDESASAEDPEESAAAGAQSSSDDTAGVQSADEDRK